MKLNELPGHSRVWVYQSNRFFTVEEAEYLTKTLDQFVDTWAAHGKKLHAAAEVHNLLFIVIAVDEQAAQASGCSIDASMAVLKEIEQKFGVSLTNRMLVATENQEDIQLLQLHTLSDEIKAGRLTENHLVYDNLVNTIADWKSNWKKPIKESWHARFI